MSGEKYFVGNRFPKEGEQVHLYHSCLSGCIFHFATVVKKDDKYYWSYCDMIEKKEVTPEIQLSDVYQLSLP